jgi:glycosyltransferase involved in cell wall biosynthesis
VLPSRKGTGETWGLVVNEGMQFGLPVIVSDGVGCHTDLVSEGSVGWTFPSGDAAGLAQAIKSAVAFTSSERQVLSAAARSRVAGFSIDAAVQGLADALLISIGR